ncbi:MAG: hypothetical protein V8R75_15420 [Oscillospiraceae bacterium]
MQPLFRSRRDRLDRLRRQREQAVEAAAKRSDVPAGGSRPVRAAAGSARTRSW